MDMDNTTISLILLALALTVNAHAAPESLTELAECARNADDAERLACYDRYASKQLRREPLVAERQNAVDRPRPDAGETAPEEPAAVEPEVSVDQFGMTGKLARENAPPAPDSITATIVAIEERPRGERVIRLDNGQVWEENSRAAQLRLEAGDVIVIEAGWFGSFKLGHPDGGPITRVQRVK